MPDKPWDQMSVEEKLDALNEKIENLNGIVNINARTEVTQPSTRFWANLRRSKRLWIVSQKRPLKRGATIDPGATPPLFCSG
jgi:hypothetical protein